MRKSPQEKPHLVIINFRKRGGGYFWNKFTPLLPWVLTKLARNRSSSLTETFIWYGLTQRDGWRQSGDFSNLSPSVLSRGTALNRITWTKSNRQTWIIFVLYFQLFLIEESLRKTKIKITPQKTLVPYPPAGDSLSFSFSLSDPGWIKHTLLVSFLLWREQNLPCTPEQYLSVVFPVIYSPISA